MRKLYRLGALILGLIVALGAPASAINRVQWWYGLQPPSSWLNVSQKNTEIGVGQLMWDILGRSNSGGIFTNMTVAPSTGLYVVVQPTTANQVASLYQTGVADSSPFGTIGSGALPADPTVIFHQGMLFGNSNAVGPLPVTGTSGWSAIDVIECQVQIVDTTPQTVNFVSSTNVASSATANRDRVDQVVCQAKLGTAALSPSVPTTDTGWVAIGQVTVAYGTATITSGMITTYTGFNGFLPAGSASTFMDLTSNQSAAGTKTFTTGITMSGKMIYNGAPALFTSQLGFESDGQTHLGLLFNNPDSSSLGLQFMTAGSLNGLSISPTAFKAGSTTTLANNLLTVQGGTFDGISLTSKTSSPLNLNTLSASQLVRVHYGDTSTSGLGVYDGGTTNSSTLTSTSLAFSGASTSSYTSTNATVYGNMVLPSIATGVCLTTDASHNVISAGGACGLSSGTITNVVGTSPIAASVTSGTATVSISATPTFTNVTTGSAATVGTHFFGTDGVGKLARSGDVFTFTGVGNASVVAAGGFTSGSSSYFPTYASINGYLLAGSTAFVPTAGDVSASRTVSCGSLALGGTTTHGTIDFGCTTGSVFTSSAPLTVAGTLTATTLAGSGSGITSATIPNAALVTSPVTAVTGSGNIASSGGLTPNITFTGTLPVANGGTGSATQNFVDLTTAQTVAGVKTFSSPPVMSGASITASTIPNGALVTSPVTSVTASGNIASSGGLTPNLTFTGVLPIGSGGTGSATQNFVDLTNNQSIAGIKTFSSAPIMSGASITSGTVPNAALVTSPVTSVSGSGNIASSGGLTPSISFTGVLPIANGGTGSSTANFVTSVTGTSPIVSSGGLTPAISCGTCLTTAGSQTVTGNDTFNGGLTMAAGQTLTGGNGQVELGITSGVTVQGVSGTLAGLGFTGTGYRMAMSTGGDMGVTGNVTAANFFNGSRRAFKTDIKVLAYDNIFGMDALGILASTDWVSYRYKPQYGDPNDTKIGFVADDTSPVLSGPKQNHFDAGALATVDALAIMQTNNRIDSLESKYPHGAQGVVVQGSTFDPRVSDLIHLVRVLYIVCGVLALWCLGLTVLVAVRRD